MTQNIAWFDHTDLLNRSLAKGGAFLVVTAPDGRANAMTIGWGQVGIVWSRPVFAVYVRKSRYTHPCITAASDFTVNVPQPGALTKALALCGSRSGRDLDKIAAAGLKTLPSRMTTAPILDGCALYYECRILARTQQALPDFEADDVLSSFYPTDDPHLVVFGEILAAYAKLS